MFCCIEIIIPVIDSEFITGIIVVLHPVKHQTVDFSICHIKKLHYLCKPKTKGTLAEWLGTGLQNRLRRFESAKYLKEGCLLSRRLLDILHRLR